MKLTKTSIDKKKEAEDLKKDKILKFLANVDHTKFKVGDILIKKWSDEDEEGNITWETVTDGEGAPVKYVYAFENEIGIGYIKELKEDGSGPRRRQPVCVTKISFDEERFFLDPEYAEHLLLSPDEEFKYAANRERIVAFRNEAIEKNRAIATFIPHYYDQATNEDTENLKNFWKALKVGDIVYAGDSIEELGEVEMEVVKATRHNRTITLKYIKEPYDDGVGEETSFDRIHFGESFYVVSTQKPFPLREDDI